MRGLCGLLDLRRALLSWQQSVNYSQDTELQARARSYEQAGRMGVAAPEAVDLAKETDATKDLYGLNDELSKGYGTNLLRARRLVERGVRFIQVVSGELDIGGENRTWDAHNSLDENHGKHGKAVDKPIAGLLDSTLVYGRVVKELLA